MFGPVYETSMFLRVNQHKFEEIYLLLISCIIHLQVDLVIGEPYFCTTLLPWHNLLFWYSRTEIQDILVQNPTVLPKVVSIKAIAVDFDHLWKIHAPVGICEGFNLDHFDKMIEVCHLFILFFISTKLSST